MVTAKIRVRLDARARLLAAAERAGLLGVRATARHAPRAIGLRVVAPGRARKSHLQRAERSLRLRAGRLAYEASQVARAVAAGRGARDPSTHATWHARAATDGAYTTGGALVLRCANGAHTRLCARARRRARDRAATSSPRSRTTCYHPPYDFERLVRDRNTSMGDTAATARLVGLASGGFRAVYRPDRQ